MRNKSKYFSCKPIYKRHIGQNMPKRTIGSKQMCKKFGHITYFIGFKPPTNRRLLRHEAFLKSFSINFVIQRVQINASGFSRSISSAIM